MSIDYDKSKVDEYLSKIYLLVHNRDTPGWQETHEDQYTDELDYLWWEMSNEEQDEVELKIKHLRDQGIL